MDVRLGSRKAAPVSMDAVLSEIHKRLGTDPGQWLQKLTANPGSFTDLERSIHQAFQQMADQVVAGLLAEATADADFAEAAKKK